MSGIPLSNVNNIQAMIWGGLFNRPQYGWGLQIHSPTIWRDTIKGFSTHPNWDLELHGGFTHSPTMRLDTMRGKTSILRARMRISPGKAMSSMATGDGSANRMRLPSTQPITTPAIVSTSNRFSRHHDNTYTTQNHFATSSLLPLGSYSYLKEVI